MATNDEARAPQEDPEVDERLDELERRATQLTEEADQATRAAAGALVELRAALSSARRQMRERGYPIANEMEPR